MIETIILNALSEGLNVQGETPAVPVLMEIPEEKPATYVVLDKTGSQRSNHIDRATFAVQSIAPSLYEAATLNEQVKAVMDQLPYLTEAVFAAELNGDYNFTDAETKERRYQAVYIITYKE